MVTVKLFGTLRLDSGIKSLEVEADTVRELYPLVMAEILRAAPDSEIKEKDVRSCMVSVNEKKANARTKLQNGDTVYIIPPAAGG